MVAKPQTPGAPKHDLGRSMRLLAFPTMRAGLNGLHFTILGLSLLGSGLLFFEIFGPWDMLEVNSWAEAGFGV